MATVDSHYARAILQCNVRQGLSIDQLMFETGLSDEFLKCKRNRVDGEKITYMVKHTWARLNDEFMGCTEHPCKHGVFALMCKYALRHKTLNEVLLQGINFYNLFSDDIQMQLTVKAKVAELIIEFSQPDLDVDFFFHEFWLMIWHRFSSWVIGKKIALTQVAFPYPRPSHYRELKNAFPCRHNFSQNNFKAVFQHTVLTLGTSAHSTRFINFFKKLSR